MKRVTKSTLFAMAASLVFAPGALAKTTKLVGTSCWTGERSLISTSKGNMAWTYTLNFTFLPDDKDAENLIAGTCIGSGALVAGKPESLPLFCSNLTGDGSTFMGRVEGGAEEMKSSYFGGTGKFEGITGGSVGGPRMKFPAPKGSFAGCRPVEIEYTVPD